MLEYWVASACTEINLFPSGQVNLVGLQSSQPFLRHTLEKLGIEPHLFQREEYKNIANTLQEEGLTEVSLHPTYHTKTH